MPEVIFNGADGRLEGRYHHAKDRDAPLAIVLHPHPLHGGTMNTRIVYDIYHMFVRRGFSALRFNFRGVGRSQESFDHGQGELRDAAAALDWMQLYNPNSRGVWVAGISFGAWIGMQLLMRRPEIEGFISVALPANLYDFTFLAPCPSSGLIVNGDRDTLVTTDSVEKLVQKLSQQRGLDIGLDLIPGADHFFTGYLERLNESIEAYLVKRLGPVPDGPVTGSGEMPKESKAAVDRAAKQTAEAN
jgi:alpha/beta superfamily hydrolase